MKKRKLFILLCCFGLPLIYLFNGCDSIKKIADTYGEPYIYTLKDSILNSLFAKAEQMGVNLKDSFLNDASQERITILVNKVAHDLDSNLIILKDSLLSEGTQNQLWTMRDGLLGKDTRELVGAIRDELLGAATASKITGLRDSLLNEKGKAEIDSLISSVINQVAIDYKDKLSPQVDSTLEKFSRTLDHQREGFGKTAKELTTTAIIAMIIAAALILIVIYFYFRAKKHRETVEVITRQIEKMPDQYAYDQLVNKIRERAEQVKVEKNLQSILNEVKSPGKEKWKDNDQAVLTLISKELTKEETAQKEELLKKIREKAEAAKLKSHLDSVLNRNKN